VGGVLGSGRAAGLPGWARRFGFAPPTLLNRSIDSGRSIATLSVSLAQVRSLAAAQAVTVNDVVLAVVGGALRRYLAEHGGLPSRSLLAAMPVSLRESGDTRMNTQAWMMPASLATDVADPVERLHVIHAAADAAKSLTRDIRPAVDVSLPSIGQPWLLTSAAALYGAAGLAERLPRLANIVVSNVPGPSLPLYLAGARLCSYWPLSIVEHGLGLNVTVMRYVESLDFGLVAARKLVPDLAPLMRAMRDALEELVAATLAPARPTPKRVNTRGVSSKASGRGEGNAAGRIRPRAAPDPSRAPRNTR